MFLRSVFSIVILIFFTTITTIRSDPNLLRTKADDDALFCPKTMSHNSCPVNCFRADPVCGADGVTYWCGCADAHCAGTGVAKLGACDGDNSSVSGQALLLINIVWLILLAFVLLLGVL